MKFTAHRQLGVLEYDASQYAKWLFANVLAP